MREAAVTTPAAFDLIRGALRARVHPALGMLVSSLAHDGVEFLRLADDVADAAAHDRLVGLPLLHPWANRIDGLRYRACGREVALPPDGPLLRYDDNGLPNHGVAWSRLPWTVHAREAASIDATLDWDRPEWLALFPFPHRLHMRVALEGDALSIDTTLHATGDAPVPVCFGFHPYLALPGAPRDAWHLRTPPLRHLRADDRLIPTGATHAFDGFDTPLAALDLDDGYALASCPAIVELAGPRHAIALELREGFPVLQLYAPRGADFICVEPMTAPANALASGDGLRVVAPGDAFRAAFALRVRAIDPR